MFYLSVETWGGSFGSHLHTQSFGSDRHARVGAVQLWNLRNRLANTMDEVAAELGNMKDRMLPKQIAIVNELGEIIDILEMYDGQLSWISEREEEGYWDEING